MDEEKSTSKEEVKITSLEDLKRFGKPMKQLFDIKGFNGPNAFTEMLSPLEALAKDQGFQNLSQSKDLLNNGGINNE